MSPVLRPVTTTLQVSSERRGRLVYAVETDAPATACLEVIEEHPGDAPDLAIHQLFGDRRVAWTTKRSTVLGAGAGRQAWALLCSAPPLELEPDGRQLVAFEVQLPERAAAGRLRLRLQRDGRADEVSPWTWYDPERASRWRSLLPSVYQAAIRARPDGPLPVLLKCMDSMLAPVEREIEGFDALLDPHRTRREFLPMLGSWLASGSREQDALPPNRAWVADTVDLAQRRGTADGLLRTLALATGMAGFSLEEQAERFHVSIRAPSAARGLGDALRRLIEQQRPAHITFDLSFGEEGA